MEVRQIYYKPSKVIGFYNEKGKVLCEVLINNKADFYFLIPTNENAIHEKDFDLCQYLDKKVIGTHYNDYNAQISIIFEDDILIIESFNPTNSHYPHLIKIKFPHKSFTIEVGSFPINMDDVAKKLVKLSQSI